MSQYANLFRSTRIRGAPPTGCRWRRRARPVLARAAHAAAPPLRSGPVAGRRRRHARRSSELHGALLTGRRRRRRRRRHRRRARRRGRRPRRASLATSGRRARAAHRRVAGRRQRRGARSAVDSAGRAEPRRRRGAEHRPVHRLLPPRHRHRPLVRQVDLPHRLAARQGGGQLRARVGRRRLGARFNEVPRPSARAERRRWRHAAPPASTRRQPFEVPPPHPRRRAPSPTRAPLRRAVGAHDLAHVCSMTDATRPVLKTRKVSPDGAMQMAFQLAHVKMHGGGVLPAYESASTAAFKHGRTQTIRSATPEAPPSPPPSATPTRRARRSALRAAVKNHSRITKEALMGEGMDRQDALRALAAADGATPKWSRSAYATLSKIILSTSTLEPPALESGALRPRQRRLLRHRLPHQRRGRRRARDDLRSRLAQPPSDLAGAMADMRAVLDGGEADTPIQTAYDTGFFAPVQNNILDSYLLEHLERTSPRLSRTTRRAPRGWATAPRARAPVRAGGRRTRRSRSTPWRARAHAGWSATGATDVAERLAGAPRHKPERRDGAPAPAARRRAVARARGVHTTRAARRPRRRRQGRGANSVRSTSARSPTRTCAPGRSARGSAGATRGRRRRRSRRRSRRSRRRAAQLAHPAPAAYPPPPRMPARPNHPKTPSRPRCRRSVRKSGRSCSATKCQRRSCGRDASAVAPPSRPGSRRRARGGGGRAGALGGGARRAWIAPRAFTPACVQV